MALPVRLFLRVLVYCFFGSYTAILSLLYSTLSTPLQKFYRQSILLHYGVELNATQFSMLLSAMTTAKLVGQLISLVFIYPKIDIWGRKVAAVVYPIVVGGLGALCQLLARYSMSVELFMLAEVFVGMAGNATVFASVIYLTECAPSRFRGPVAVIAVYHGTVAWQLTSLLSKPGILGSDERWPWISVLSLVLGLISTTISLACPDSPKWLCAKGDLVEAEKSVRFYHGKDADVEAVLEEYSREKNLTFQDKISIKDILRDESLREAFFIVFVCHLSVEVSPVQIELAYNIVLKTRFGFSLDEAMNQRMIFSLVFAPTAFFFAWCIEKFGRRLTFHVGTMLLAAISSLLFVVNLLVHLHPPGLVTRNIGYLLQGITSIYSVSGYPNLYLLMLSELCAPSVRVAIAQSEAILSLIGQMIFLAVYPPLDSLIGPSFYIPLLVFQVVLAAFLFNRLPETKAKPVDKIVNDLREVVRSRAHSLAVGYSQSDEIVPLIRPRSSTAQ